MKKIVSFDFDGTMCFTPEPIEGEKIWKEKTGTVWPYTGWWSKKETLDMNIFDIPVNPFVYKKYLEAVAEDDTMVILATGRLLKLQREVEKVLQSHNLEFDLVQCNWGGETYKFKTKLFEDLINKARQQATSVGKGRSRFTRKVRRSSSKRTHRRARVERRLR